MLKQRTVLTCMSLEQILYNSYTGISSNFLREQIEKQGGNFKQKEVALANTNDPSGKVKTKDRIWAGSLHIDLKTLGRKQKAASDYE